MLLRLRRRAVPIFLATAGAWAIPEPANACSPELPPTVAGSLPRDGATDVPLDVSPVVVGMFVSLDVTTAAGDPVAHVLVPFSQGTGIEFSGPLLPDTSYVIAVTGDSESAASVTFTTGQAEGDAEIPPLDEAVVTALTTEQPGYWVYLCASPSDYLCVSADVPEGFALVVDTAFTSGPEGRHVLTRGLGGKYWNYGWYNQRDGAATGFLAADWDLDSCVSFALRDQTGREGPPLEVCPDDIERAEPATLASIACDDGVIRYEGGEPPPEGAAGAANAGAGGAGGGTITASAGFGGNAIDEPIAASAGFGGEPAAQGDPGDAPTMEPAPDAVDAPFVDEEPPDEAPVDTGSGDRDEPEGLDGGSQADDSPSEPEQLRGVEATPPPDGCSVEVAPRGRSSVALALGMFGLFWLVRRRGRR